MYYNEKHFCFRNLKNIYPKIQIVFSFGRDSILLIGSGFKKSAYNDKTDTSCRI